MIRNFKSIIRGQIRNGHTKNENNAIEKIEKAYYEISYQLAVLNLNLETIFYESFVEKEVVRQRLFDKYNLNPDMKYINYNKI